MTDSFTIELHIGKCRNLFGIVLLSIRLIQNLNYCLFYFLLMDFKFELSFSPCF